MGLVSKTYTFSSGATIVASEHNTNFDTLYTLANGNIDNTNIIASAGIEDSKLAQITTASKVAGTALTGSTYVYYVSATSSNIVTSSATTVNMTEMSITFVPHKSTNPILVYFNGTFSSNSTACPITTLIDIDGTGYGTRQVHIQDGASINHSNYYFTTLSSASHTAKIQWFVGLVIAGTAIAHDTQRALTVIEFSGGSLA